MSEPAPLRAVEIEGRKRLRKGRDARLVSWETAVANRRYQVTWNPDSGRAGVVISGGQGREVTMAVFPDMDEAFRFLAGKLESAARQLVLTALDRGHITPDSASTLLAGLK